MCFIFSCCSTFPVASDGDHPDSEILLSVDGDNLKQQEEEVRRKIELEAEERKLEETLEYQRRIENEAKLKHLAEQQHKKSNQTFPDTVTELPCDVYLESGADDAHKPLVSIILRLSCSMYCNEIEIIAIGVLVTFL